VSQQQQQIALGTGISIHVREHGEGPAVVFVHGFPELGYSWRYQLAALAAAGLRAMAPDMRGYGETTAPAEVSAYQHRLICDDLLALLDALDLERAVFVGHDWGGAIVWAMALHHPQRVRAVAGINTPYCGQPPAPMLEMVKDSPGVWDYQFYFQEPGVAEAELDADPEHTINLLMRSSDPVDRLDALGGTSSVRERGGILAGLPEKPVRSVMLTAADLETYAAAFRRTGFRGGLNWYRNDRANWEWGEESKEARIRCPALMVTVGRDLVLKPSLSEGMERVIPQLQRGHIEECGHWTQQERPEELNRILGEWLAELPD
jgi:soluble epoxide hydrolase/lipid-phosphate phosphatase